MCGSSIMLLIRAQLDGSAFSWSPCGRTCPTREVTRLPESMSWALSVTSAGAVSGPVHVLLATLPHWDLLLWSMHRTLKSFSNIAGHHSHHVILWSSFLSMHCVLQVSLTWLGLIPTWLFWPALSFPSGHMRVFSKLLPAYRLNGRFG